MNNYGLTPNVRVARSELWTSNTPLQALTDQRSRNPYRLQKTTSLTPKPYRPHSNPRNPNPTTPQPQGPGLLWELKVHSLGVWGSEVDLEQQTALQVEPKLQTSPLILAEKTTLLGFLIMVSIYNSLKRQLFGSQVGSRIPNQRIKPKSLKALIPQSLKAP